MIGASGRSKLRAQRPARFSEFRVYACAVARAVATESNRPSQSWCCSQFDFATPADAAATAAHG